MTIQRTKNLLSQPPASPFFKKGRQEKDALWRTSTLLKIGGCIGGLSLAAAGIYAYAIGTFSHSPSSPPSPPSPSSSPSPLLQIAMSTQKISDPFAPASGFTRWHLAESYCKRGKEILTLFTNTLQFSLAEEEKRADYLQYWRERQECPVNLAAFVDYQRANGFSPKVSKEALEDLFGRQRDLSGSETRGLYHEIINTNQRLCHPSPVFNLWEISENPSEALTCYVPEHLSEALIATRIRGVAREYARSRMNDAALQKETRRLPWYSQIAVGILGSTRALQLRDWMVHGTTNPGDLNFIVGKYGQKDEAAMSKAIYEAAMRTNKEFDRLAENTKS